MARTAFIATIQVVLDGDILPSEAHVCDYISETLRPMREVVDWSYLQIGGQLLSPAEKLIADADQYEEGDAFQ